MILVYVIKIILYFSEFRADYWEFTTDKGPCLNNGTKCTFYMSLCKNLPDIGAGDSCKDAAVCQKSEESGTYTKLGTTPVGTPLVNLSKSLVVSWVWLQNIFPKPKSGNCPKLPQFV
jgi:hypothetical protein